MIERMRKYTMILHHSDYLNIMTGLQELGMLHIEKSTAEKSDKLIEVQKEIEAYTEALKFMQKKIPDNGGNKSTTLLPVQMRQKIENAHLEKERLTLQYNVLAKEITDLEPWGEFDHAALKALKQHGLRVELYACSLHHFNPEWAEKYALTVINNISPMIYFAVLHKIDEPLEIDAEAFKMPPRTLAELRKQEQQIAEELKAIDEFYTDNSTAAVELFSAELEKLTHAYDFEDATLQSVPEADNQVLILLGWIPKRLEADLLSFINQHNIVHFSKAARVEDNPPISLRNNRFARIFEPIGKMFMLPYYNELDMTPFLAPFFMMFFGFCSGDSGYGIVLFLIGWFLKKKIKNKAIHPLLTLLQVLGIGTVVMGFILGNFFAFDLKEIPFLNPLVPIRNHNQIFNFALLLGLIQIIVGKVINSVKRMMQFGFVHGLAIIGIIFFVISISLMGSTMLGAKPGKILNYAPYGIYLGLAMVFLLNSPGKNILFNIANGLWIMYNTVTSFFGDILSYIRLFALGVSSGILGYVINTMAAQFGSIPYIGPVIYIFFMVGGHGLNIALSSLGAFVHPMRLTFVEFFNNAGFSGPGIPYKPFGKTKTVK
ncbi:MAG: V-type ATPase 116kDa subunit family protein [Candidatus Cloacimonadaceae bacterium]